FGIVYGPRQPMDEGAAVRMNKAHDDYLQALLEGGIPWALAIVAALIAYVQRARTLARDPRATTVAVGAAIGIALMLVHSLVDYNLEVPANAMYFAFLWGL